MQKDELECLECQEIFIWDDKSSEAHESIFVFEERVFCCDVCLKDWEMWENEHRYE